MGQGGRQTWARARTAILQRPDRSAPPANRVPPNGLFRARDDTVWLLQAGSHRAPAGPCAAAQPAPRTPRRIALWPPARRKPVARATGGSPRAWRTREILDRTRSSERRGYLRAAA